MSDTVYLVEMFDCEYSLPVGIFSRRELAEEWARNNARAAGVARNGSGELDWRVGEYVINAPDKSWTACESQENLDYPPIRPVGLPGT